MKKGEQKGKPEGKVKSMPRAEERIVVRKKMNALEELADKLKVDPEGLKKTLMKSVFKNISEPEDFVSAIIVANKYNLNPILKEIYAFPARGGGIIPIVSIDGWISLVNRSAKYDGVKLTENFDESGKNVLSVTAEFYLKGMEHPITVTEYMAECEDKSKEPWKRWPRRMLRHKAYIQGARVAFGFSGIFDQDEAERIVESEEAEQNKLKPIVETPKEIPAKKEAPGAG